MRVLDDRSLNGVFLDGERVEWGELLDGSELIIGRYRLFFIDTATAVELTPAARRRLTAADQSTTCRRA